MLVFPVFLRRFILPVFSAALGALLIFVTLFLYPLACRSNIFDHKDLNARPGLVAFHGFVADLSKFQTDGDPLSEIRKAWQGKDISLLLPRMLWLGRLPLKSDNSNNNYADNDINQCVKDPLVADAWLKLYLQEELNRLFTLNNQTGTLDLCAKPRHLTTTLPQMRVVANEIAAVTDSRFMPSTSSNLKLDFTPIVKHNETLARDPPDPSVKCIVDPGVVRQLYANVIGHVGITLNGLGVRPPANFLETFSELEEKRLLNTTHVNTLGGLVWIGDYLFDVSRYLQHATAFYLTSPVANSSTQLNIPVAREGDTMFLPRDLTDYLSRRVGLMSRTPDTFAQDIPDENTRRLYRRCMMKLFYVGKRGSRGWSMCAECFNRDWLFMAIVILSALVTLSKSFASLLALRRFAAAAAIIAPTKNARRGDGDTRMAESHTLFFVPVFAEPVAVLQRSLSSIVQCHVANKVLVVVCDGNVRPKGEVKDTWQVVLDHLRYRQAPGQRDEPPMALHYTSLGQGRKRTNLARVYAGYCTATDGSTVPWVVVVKIGHPWERTTALPGNRGKRDSMHLVVRYLHTLLTYPGLNPTTVFSPLECALHQALNASGIDPTRFEFLIVVDGDTYISRRAPLILLDALAADRGLAAASGGLTADNAFTTLASAIAAFRLHMDTHVRAAAQQMFSFSAPVNTAFTAYRIQAPPPPLAHTSGSAGARATDDADSGAGVLGGTTAVLTGAGTESSVSLSSASSASANSITHQLDEKPGVPDSTAATASTSAARDLILAHSQVLHRLSLSSLTSAFEQNLFLLGEDAHMTTTLLLAHPTRRITYIPRARAWTPVPTGCLAVFQWLTRRWIAHVFTSMDQLFAPLALHHRSPSAAASGPVGYVWAAVKVVAKRSWTLFSLLVALTLPWIALIFLAVAFLSWRKPSSFFRLATYVWAGLVGAQLVITCVAKRWDVLAQIFVYCVFGVVMVWIFVPLWGLVTVTRVRWVDQWPAEGSTRYRRPGGLLDLVVEMEAEAFASGTASVAAGAGYAASAAGAGGAGSIMSSTAAARRVAGTSASVIAPMSMVGGAGVLGTSPSSTTSGGGGGGTGMLARRGSALSNKLRISTMSTSGAQRNSVLSPTTPTTTVSMIGSSLQRSSALAAPSPSAASSPAGTPSQSVTLLSGSSPSTPVASALTYHLAAGGHAPLATDSPNPSAQLTTLDQSDSPLSPAILTPPPHRLDEESPEILLGMRTTVFRTHAAQALSRHLLRSPMLANDPLLDPNVSLTDPASEGGRLVRELVDAVTARLMDELRDDRIALLDHLVEVEVVEWLVAQRRAGSSGGDAQ
ncbi:chitin synthase-domain-containing protein [Catenaria anguillulae PL171]|uniref:Chitin synthase-domain-containing protein n=1 Tax=Catenaria anguillulae PL171 TaxID=765915 RepID=A0A1Y2HTX2_9FUNG|nr:chitin synthase-domain-containing protein [Catenaria anguillulae PL171]